MQSRGLRIVVAGLMAIGLSGLLPAAGEEIRRLPERKAGLWQLHTIMDEGRGPQEQTMTLCVDADMERNTVTASHDEHARRCSAYDITRDGAAMVVDMSCQFEGRQVTSRTEMTGDFQSTFNVRIESKTSGDQGGRTVVVNRTITQVGTYLGADCGDLAGGEAKSQDGTKVLVQ